MSDTNAKVLVIAEHDSLILAAETLKNGNGCPATWPIF